MSLQVIPEEGPVTIGGQQTSQLFDVFVPPGEKTVFLRFIALFRDNEPLGGEAPTFQIRVGTGVVTPVGPNSAGVDIPDGNGNVVGSITCERLPNDISLLTISDIVENSGPWKMRIRNNDPESLRFLGFTSQHVEKTLQPWMVMLEPDQLENGVALMPDLLTPEELASDGRGYDVPYFFIPTGREQRRKISIQNWGTAPLTFFESLGPLRERGECSCREICRSNTKRDRLVRGS